MKRFLSSVVLFVVAGILSGCTNQANADEAKEFAELMKQVEQLSLENEALQSMVEEQRKELEEMKGNDFSVILAKDIVEYPRSLYKETTLDIDQDGEDEIIELYVNAEKMENDLFAWDDGQTWLLAVKDGEKTYPLFDNFVQLGSIEMSTTTFDGKPGIVMLETWHSDIYIHKFTYDGDAKGFVKETFYKKENINQQYNPPASYALFKDAYELMEQAFTDKAVKALGASENNLQELKDRAAVYDPILVDLRRAQWLFKTVGLLNPELQVSLESAVHLLNQMEINPPTSEQMNQLRDIHDVFKANEITDLIIEEENRIHPDIEEKLQRLEDILNGKK
ncbi:bZIP transcription factor [Bacillus sp. DTU_2020_1000418_1_SI_GHA_SEK_038]|uniref:bZIP transcription factor n=1 Tax=Bacillus sp. DTU_2020_1000418_1_SI_GHA_SEK_038 TaxID=3077585 RepID=UPI0028E870A9|nr:bZIP transcription factor [Bacillus sp. DTU_2020_1000418_1_SI_GHA_SEK_038]WNS76522.1 bZIP transcription factor [Bacillus sp. DTU_2020_1000418_1_SI_GHA_SEK_038]